MRRHAGQDNASLDLASDPRSRREKLRSRMRELILLRHAHAEPAAPGQADLDRPLSAEGLAEAEAAGRWLRRTSLVPDRVLCSPSRRTRETLEAVLAAIGYVDQRLEPSIYEATAGTLVGLADAHREAERLMLVGHNPGPGTPGRADAQRPVRRLPRHAAGRHRGAERCRRTPASNRESPPSPLSGGRERRQCSAACVLRGGCWPGRAVPAGRALGGGRPRPSIRPPRASASSCARAGARRWTGVFPRYEGEVTHAARRPPPGGAAHVADSVRDHRPSDATPRWRAARSFFDAERYPRGRCSSPTRIRRAAACAAGGRLRGRPDAFAASRRHEDVRSVAPSDLRRARRGTATWSPPAASAAATTAWTAGVGADATGCASCCACALKAEAAP